MKKLQRYNSGQWVKDEDVEILEEKFAIAMECLQAINASGDLSPFIPQLNRVQLIRKAQHALVKISEVGNGSALDI